MSNPTSRTRFLHAATLLLAGAACVFASGCGANVARLGPGAASPGLFYANVTYPNSLNPNMSYEIRFERDDIELLGPVAAEGSSEWYFFFVSRGDSGYGTLMDQARLLGADGVMNVTIDTRYKSFFIFYSEIVTRLNAVAYRYKRSPNEAAAAAQMAASQAAARQQGAGKP